MTEEYRKTIYKYFSCLYIFIQAYYDGEITKEEYTIIEEKLAEKVGLNPLSVYRFRANDIRK